MTAETPATGLTDAKVWDEGYTAGWWGCVASFDATRDGVPEPEQVPNPYAARAKPAPSGDEREALAGLQRRLFEECETAGWDPEKRNTFGDEIAHLHEEVSEAFREWRLHKDCEVRSEPSGKPTGVPIEFADVLIGLFYNAELHGFDLIAAVEAKHQYNLTRRYADEGRQLHPTVSPAPSAAEAALASAVETEWQNGNIATDVFERLAALAPSAGPDEERHPSVLAAGFHRAVSPAPSAAEAATCNCCPGGFTPDSYEGPKEDCPVHGRSGAEAALICTNCESEEFSCTACGVRPDLPWARGPREWDALSALVKKRYGELTVAEAELERVRALADLRDITLPVTFAFGADANYVNGFKAAQAQLRAALAPSAGPDTTEGGGES